MAKEITFTDRTDALKSTIKWGFDPGTIQLDWANARWYDVMHTIGTSEESISAFGDVVTPTVVWLFNTNTINYVDWGTVTTSYKFILPKHPYPATRLIWKAGTTLFLKANSAECDVRVMALET